MSRRRSLASPGRFALAALAVGALCPTSGLAAPTDTPASGPAYQQTDLSVPGGTPFLPIGINTPGDVVGVILAPDNKVHVAIYHPSTRAFTDLYPAPLRDPGRLPSTMEVVFLSNITPRTGQLARY